MKVLTVKGLVEFDQLQVKDVVVEVADNYRKLATEYYLDGELVKRSVTVDVFRPLMGEALNGNLNG